MLTLQGVRNAGMGLFARYFITAGTVLAEYRGIIRPNDTGGDHELFPYAVSVTMEDETTKMIDGIDENGNVLSFAPRGNDAGPRFANTILAEYAELPGRVFLEATRNIHPGEEIFYCYGPEYWNIDEYPIYDNIGDYGNLPEYAKQHQSKSRRKPQLCSEPSTYTPPMSSPKKRIPTEQYICTIESTDGLKLKLKKIKS